MIDKFIKNPKVKDGALAMVYFCGDHIRLEAEVGPFGFYLT